MHRRHETGGRVRRLALLPLLVSGVLASGCGGDDEEQTTIDLTGLVEVNVGGDVPVEAQEQLEAAIVSSIQTRAPDNVRVVYGGGGQTDETGAPGEICQTIPQVCDQEDFNEIIRDAIQMGPQARQAGGIVQGDGGRQVALKTNLDPAFIRRLRFNIAGVRAYASVSENGEITTQIVAVPPGVTPLDSAGGDETEEEETTETETDTTTTEPAPTETEPAPAEPAPAPVEP